MRDDKGRIILNDYKRVNDYIAGRKKKIWLSKDGKKYLFKTGGSNYEIYAELIACELAKQCGFSTAFYDLAILDGESGVLTPSFLKPGNIIIGGDQYFSNVRNVAVQNNMCFDFRKNSIDNILSAVAINESGYDDIAEIILFRLLQLWSFDLAIMESDRNSTNWSLIRNVNGFLTLAPIYDCSTMCMLNNDVYSLQSNLRSEFQIYNIIDSIQYSLKLRNDGVDNMYDDFSFLCYSFPNEMYDIIECLCKMDVYKAIDNINSRISSEMNSGSFEIPYFIGTWVNKLIKFRLETLKSIFENTKKKCK